MAVKQCLGAWGWGSAVSKVTCAQLKEKILTADSSGWLHKRHTCLAGHENRDDSPHHPTSLHSVAQNFR